MIIKKIIVGTLQENCYLIINDKNVLIVDPGDEFEKIDNKIKDNNLNPIGILITHRHFDHIGALNELINKYSITVCDYQNKIKFPYFVFKIIDTPGHTSDSITYYFEKEKIMFTGDFLFKLSIGRTDLPSGSYDDMLKSIDNIKKYKEDIIIYPGHGEKTSLNIEKMNNEFFQ